MNAAVRELTTDLQSWFSPFYSSSVKFQVDVVVFSLFVRQKIKEDDTRPRETHDSLFVNE